MAGLIRKPGASLHHQLYALLHSGISSGRYQGGSLLPSEDVLAETYNVSRATVRRAMQTLETKGLIDRRPGIGTRVFDWEHETQGGPVVVDLFGAPGGPGDLVLLGFGWETASVKISALMGLPPAASVLKVTRLRVFNDVPLRLTRHYLPEHLGEKLSPSQLDGRTVKEVLADAGVEFTHSEQIIGAVLADAADAEIFKIEVGSALLDMFRILRDPTNEVVLMQQANTPPEREKVKIRLSGDEIGPA